MAEFRRSYAGLTPAAAEKVTAKRAEEAQNETQVRNRGVSPAAKKAGRKNQSALRKPCVTARGALPGLPKESSVLVDVQPDQADSHDLVGKEVLPSSRQGEQLSFEASPSGSEVSLRESLISRAKRKAGRRKKDVAATAKSAPTSSSEEADLRVALKHAESFIEELRGKLGRAEAAAKEKDVLVIEADELKKTRGSLKAEVSALQTQLRSSQTEASRLRDQLSDLEAQVKIQATSDKGLRRGKPEVLSVGKGRRPVTVLRGQTIAPRAGKLTLNGVSNEISPSLKEKFEPKELSQKAQDKGLHGQAQRVVTLLEMTLMGVDPDTSNATVCERAVRGIEQVKISLDRLTLALMGRAAVA
ncbi:hypothetical protein AA14337_3285 [Acetobacter malorum DSM 14337]|uniref:Uncharacterized protein n=1 Tax=Acetobacter malorum DSM 14337 TaxID=1307910 RepID=A0ABQ0Q0Q1_9PROT|nr:hypothetical protein AA14337_3285 [Acetobacter malorum DSM 14337]